MDLGDTKAAGNASYITGDATTTEDENLRPQLDLTPHIDIVEEGSADEHTVKLGAGDGQLAPLL